MKPKTLTVLPARENVISLNPPCGPCAENKVLKQGSVVRLSSGCNLVYFPGWFTPNELAQNLAWSKSRRMAASVTFGGPKDARKSETCLVNLNAGAFLRNKLEKTARLTALLLDIQVDEGQPSGVQVAHYKPGDYYREHGDTDYARTYMARDRKISISVCLEGPPTLKLSHIETPVMQPGDALAFPSWQRHSVPKCDEERWSLVAWAEGQRWK